MDSKLQFTKIQKWVTLIICLGFFIAGFHLLFLKATFDIEQQKIIFLLINDRRVEVEKTENLLLKIGQFEEKTRRLEEKIDKLAKEKKQKKSISFNKNKNFDTKFSSASKK